MRHLFTTRHARRNANSRTCRGLLVYLSIVGISSMVFWTLSMAVKTQRLALLDETWPNQVEGKDVSDASNGTRSVDVEQEETKHEDGDGSVIRNYSGEASTTPQNQQEDLQSWNQESQLASAGQQNSTLPPKWVEDGSSQYIDNKQPRNESLPRLGYIITSSQGRLHGLVSLLAAIYHPSNAYAIHIDSKIPENEEEIIEREIKAKMPANVVWLRSAAVTWGGVSMLLVTLRGLATLQKTLGDHWDFYINLSASDMPLLPQETIARALAKMPPRASLMSGAPYKGPDEGSDIDRSSRIVVDNALSLGKHLDYTLEWPDGGRELPKIFVPYKGEGWFVLSRELAALATNAAEYWPGLLVSYFTNWFASDESFMQTLACTDGGKDAATAYSDNFRHIVWSGGGSGHPDILRGVQDLKAALSSGAFFARKFAGDGIERRALIHYMQHSTRHTSIVDDPGYRDVYAVYKKFSELFFKRLGARINASVVELETQVDIAMHLMDELQPMQRAALSSRVSRVTDRMLCVP